MKYDAGQQRTVVRCFAGCDNELVLDKVGLRVADMFDRRPERTDRGYTPRPRPREITRADQAIDAAGLPLIKPKRDLGSQVSAWKPEAVYPYARPDGTVAGEVIREEARFSNGRDKRFHQRAWNTETGWQDTGFEKIPFQLPRVLDAIEDGRTVYVCEGEKDVLAAESANLVATTNAGGALAWSPEHAAWLRGASTVVIVADKDAPGYRRAEKVMASLVGLVQRVRIVQAATGKDLHDHIAAGHEIGELEPIPHLDPFTATGQAPAPEIPSAETDVVSADLSAPQEGTSMSIHLLDEQRAHHDDTVDHIGQGWAAFMRLIMSHLIKAAEKQAEASRLAAERKANEQEDERREAEARLAIERAAAESRLRKIHERGLENASRAEIAQAVADAAAWAQDSEVAKQALAVLRTHVKERFGIELDAATGRIVAEAPTSPELVEALGKLEAERAARERLRKAQDHMVKLVASEELDESVKAELYAEIEKWRAHPSAARLGELTKKLADKGVGEETRTQIRHVASYLGAPGQETTLADGKAPTVSSTTELRKLSGPLVDPGEEAKPRVDQLLAAYQDNLRRGASTASIRERLGKELAVLTPEDQEKARARGADIRKNPAGRFAAMWPNHVDRDELGATVRAYVVLAPQAEAVAVKANDINDATATAMRKQTAKHRAWIQKAIKDGQGLHPLEREQLASVLRDVEAGKAGAPEVLWVDDRSAAVFDTDRATRIAHDASHAHRRQVEKTLDTNAVPRGAVRASRDDLTKVMDTQSAVAAGRASLSDYEQTGVARRFDARLAASGVSQPLRNRISAQLMTAAGEATSLGKQAQRIAERWAERREAVEAERTPTKPAYDSAARRAGMEANLAAQGLGPDQVAQRMAADAGHAKPVGAAVKRTPGEARKTAPGQGVHRLNHLRKGRGHGDPSQGR
ncbi:toprim domain-containing protein [Nocardia sp. NPDC052001]|uniref:toprim domain-containing protein n=1 Tax=Nocardia sp. NPDC052001 TaxID=3154853 RepID=UPI003438491B